MIANGIMVNTARKIQNTTGELSRSNKGMSFFMPGIELVMPGT